jgi:hypothetical protein
MMGRPSSGRSTSIGGPRVEEPGWLVAHPGRGRGHRPDRRGRRAGAPPTSSPADVAGQGRPGAVRLPSAVAHAPPARRLAADLVRCRRSEELRAWLDGELRFRRRQDASSSIREILSNPEAGTRAAEIGRTPPFSPVPLCGLPHCLRSATTLWFCYAHGACMSPRTSASEPPTTVVRVHAVESITSVPERGSLMSLLHLARGPTPAGGYSTSGPGRSAWQ